mmetsp:Transcript_11938/g.32110  ORF Transcript_11938/g.32110 Transcript_11938/m.32110 type:complete len:264 (+) Transcript_11938:26-817(+)
MQAAVEPNECIAFGCGAGMALELHKRFGGVVARTDCPLGWRPKHRQCCSRASARISAERTSETRHHQLVEAAGSSGVSVVQAASRKMFERVAHLKTAVFSPELDERGRERERELVASHLLRLMQRMHNSREQVIYVASGTGSPQNVVGCAQYRELLAPVDGVYGKVWYISSIAVLPSARRQGIARHLIARIIFEAQCTRTDALVLFVEPTNFAALRLYESVGFSPLVRNTVDAVGVAAQKLLEHDPMLAEEQCFFLSINKQGR